MIIIFLVSLGLISSYPQRKIKLCWHFFPSSLLSLLVLFLSFFLTHQHIRNKNFYLDLRRRAGLSTRPRFASRDCRTRSRCCLSRGIIVRGSLRGGCTGPERTCTGSARRCHMPFTPTAQLNLIICLIF